MIVTSEYVYRNPELCEIKDIIEKTRLEHEHKYGYNYCRENDIQYNVKFLDKIKKNKTKNISTKSIKNLIIASQNRYELNKINKTMIIKTGSIEKNVIITYMKCHSIPLLWRKFFLNIANNRDYVNNYCNRKFSRFDQHCREWYLHNLINSSNNLHELFDYDIYLEWFVFLNI